MERAYNRVAKRPFLDRLMRELPEPHAGKRVLEVGCKHGWDVEKLRDIGVEAYGLDLELASAYSVRPELVEKGIIRAGDAAEITRRFPAFPFNAVISTALLSLEGLGIVQEFLRYRIGAEIDPNLHRRADEVSETRAMGIHRSVFEVLAKGGLAIHFVEEVIIGNAQQLAQIGYEVIEATAQTLVLRKP